MRNPLLPLLALLGACATADPAADHLGGAGDPVRGAALNAPRLLGDTGVYRNRPADAALAAVQMEVLAEAFLTDPRYAPDAQGSTQHAMRLGRAELRRAIGIAPDAPADAVIATLREAAAAMTESRFGRAEAALSGPDVPVGGAEALRRLSALPTLPRVSEAAGAAVEEIRQRDAGRRR
jgi:hypothetical protein